MMGMVGCCGCWVDVHLAGQRYDHDEVAADRV
jgi:hypothetical protein